MDRHPKVPSSWFRLRSGAASGAASNRMAVQGIIEVEMMDLHERGDILRTAPSKGAPRAARRSAGSAG